jgi:hypothetical protein
MGTVSSEAYFHRPVAPNFPPACPVLHCRRSISSELSKKFLCPCDDAWLRGHFSGVLLVVPRWLRYHVNLPCVLSQFDKTNQVPPCFYTVFDYKFIVAQTLLYERPGGRNRVGRDCILAHFDLCRRRALACDGHYDKG